MSEIRTTKYFQFIIESAELSLNVDNAFQLLGPTKI